MPQCDKYPTFKPHTFNEVQCYFDEGTWPSVRLANGMLLVRFPNEDRLSLFAASDLSLVLNQATPLIPISNLPS